MPLTLGRIELSGMWYDHVRNCHGCKQYLGRHKIGKRPPACQSGEKLYQQSCKAVSRWSSNG